MPWPTTTASANVPGACDCGHTAAYHLFKTGSCARCNCASFYPMYPAPALDNFDEKTPVTYAVDVDDEQWREFEDVLRPVAPQMCSRTKKPHRMVTGIDEPFCRDCMEGD